MHVAAASPVTPDQLLLVRMRETADLSQEATLPRGAERRTAVWEDLVSTAARTQKPALSLLDDLTEQGFVTAARSIPVGNAIVVTAAVGKQQAVADALKGVAEIGSVLGNPGAVKASDVAKGVRTAAAPAVEAESGAALLAADTNTAKIEWGVERIGAPKAWSAGYTGKGITVGLIDSGLAVKHPSIVEHYRGTNADGSTTHDYNWIDAGGFTTGSFTPEPYDNGGHGTHVGGTIAGGTTDHAIGVAPDAKLMVARMVFSDSIDSTISALDGLQFMLAPTRTDGTAPDPTKGADVVNNSWGTSPWERDEHRSAFDALKAAGILLVNSAGNTGPRGQVGAPAGYPGHLSIGATDSNDGVASFSSTGPSRYDATANTPNIAAPGVSIRSASPRGGFQLKDGTSMASPHVAGAVALMLQAKPDASYDEIRVALESTATDVGTTGVDLRTGYGVINVDKAIEALLEPTKD